MRCFARVLLAGLMAFLVVVPLRAQTVADASEAAAKDKASKRLTIAVIGDSLGDGLWEGLFRQLRSDKRIAVYRGAKRSVGFTTSDMTEQIDAALAAGPVHAFVVMLGANDDRRSFFAGTGKALALFATPQWVELYRGRVERFMDYAGAKSVPVVWLQLPAMRDGEATKAAKLINDITAEAARSRPAIALMQTWSLTVDDTGAYLPYFNDLHGKRRLMRHSDGLHFSEPGYELLAHMAFDRLAAVSPLFTAVSAKAAGAPEH